MPPAIIAVAAAVASATVGVLVTAGVISAVVGAIITVAIAIAAQIAISLTARKPTATRTNQGEELKLKLDPGMTRQIILGRQATGGSIVWSFTYGSTTEVPNNAYLVRIIALSDLPCNALVGVHEGKTTLTFAGDVTTGLRACDQHHGQGGTIHMWLRVYLGSPTPTADADVVSWSGGQWTTNHKGVNMCYAVVRYLYDGEGNAFPNGEPGLVFVLDGVRCYDQRFDDTRTNPVRTGTQRLNDPSTWGFSRNTAVQAQQVLRGFYSNNVLLIGAQAEERDLDDAMLLSAYNTCDEVVSYSGGSQPRYRAGYVASSSQSIADVLVQLQAAMDGRIIDRGGAITLRPGATHTPVFSLTDDDLVWDAERSWQPKKQLADLYNFVDGVFVDEATIFQEKPFPPLRSTTYETEDGGQRLEYQVAYGAVTDWAQVQRMTKRIHVSSRFQGTTVFFLPLWGLEMEQDDWFTYTSDRWGFIDKTFVAMNVDLVMNPGLMLQIIASETSEDIDGWDYAVDERPRSDTQWTPPTGLSDMPIPTLAPVAATKKNDSDVAETYGVVITVTDLGTLAGVAEDLEIEIAPQADHSAPNLLGKYPARDQTIENYSLLAGTAYSIRGRTTNSGQVGDWSAWTDFTTDSSTLNYVVTTNQALVFSANADGTLNPSGQLPYETPVTVTRNGTSITLSDDVSYSITPNNCSATVDTTNGSSTKGLITITAIPGWTASISVVATVFGVQQPAVVISIAKSTSATGGGGGSSGGSGSKSASDTSFPDLSTTSYVDWAGPLTVTLASGESLYGSGTVQYDKFSQTGSHATAKWQYSPAGAGTWTDFPSSPVDGSDAFRDSDFVLFSGAITMTQTQGGLSAGDYDVKIVAKNSGGGTLRNMVGTVTIEAKV